MLEAAALPVDGVGTPLSTVSPSCTVTIDVVQD